MKDLERAYPLALPEGTVLDGRYIVERVLGQGGFGITYRAKDHRTGGTVAVKEYFPDACAARDGTHDVTAYSGDRKDDFLYGKECFLEEARTLAEFIGEEHIVQVRSYFEENGTAYFAMDYVEGISLQELIRQRGGRLGWEETKELLFPIMDALAAVHRKGIIHRDVAPDNIVLAPGGSVKLLDFGAARYSMGDRSQSLDVVLKHGFAPCEQYTRHGRQGPYTDVYALAATMYYALTGRLLPDSIDRLGEDRAILPSTLMAELDRETEDALMKGLAVQPEDRFGTMEEWKAALAAEHPEEETVVEDAGRRVKKERDPRLQSFLRNGIGLAVFVAALAVAWQPGDEQNDEPGRSWETEEFTEGNYDYMIEDGEASIQSYTGTETSVHIPAIVRGVPVTRIGDSAFEDCATLLRVEIPEGIRYIGEYAFYGCTRLEEISLPDSLDEMGDSAFGSCLSLRSVELPEGMMVIENGVFRNCESLESIRIPDSVEVIWQDAFTYCESLSGVSIPADCVVEDEAFDEDMREMVVRRNE